MSPNNQVWRCDLKSPCVKFCESKNNKHQCGVRRKDEMKIFDGYILVSEITGRANKSAAWLYSTKSIEIEYMGNTPVVKKTSIQPKYQHLAEQCQDLRNYYTYASFSVELGRTKDFMNVLENQRKKQKKEPFESIKVRSHRLLKLSEEFIILVEEGLSPYKLGQNYDPNDYDVIIEMQNMKIGFY